MPTVVAGGWDLPLFVCVFFPPNISENDAARFTTLDIEMFHDES